MAKIIRTKTQAKGGITNEEKRMMDDHAKLWISQAMRTDPIEPEKIIPAIEGLYAAAGFKKPRVVIVPSPLVMAFAYGASAAIWHKRNAATYAATAVAIIDATRDATAVAIIDATRDATDAATYVATDVATIDATDVATAVATDVATRDATDVATYAAIIDATRDATDVATRDATIDATYAATHAAIIDATRDATRDATDVATDAATRAATRDATIDATYAATDVATYAATRAATDAAIIDATIDATRDATDAATDVATDAATRAATRDATIDATAAATAAATYAATRAATDAATRVATRVDGLQKSAKRACFDLAGELGLKCASQWWRIYHGGNMWSYDVAYLTAFRDVLRLDLPEHENYAYWEQAAIHGGFRVMHEKFCFVSDFPEVLLVDDQNRPHCENGPSHRWRDGWALYHWHGVRVPAHWIENRANLDPVEVLKAENVEQRAAGASIIGWAKMADKLQRRVIDGDPESDLGALVELTLPGLPEPGRFLMAKCPRNGTICEGVPHVSDIDGLPIETAIAAQAWRIGDPQSEYQHPPKRT